MNHRIPAAYHEAGHAVAMLRYRIGFKVIHIADDDGILTLSDGTVKTDAGGTVEVSNPAEIYSWTSGDRFNQFLTMLLAGVCAQKVMEPSKTRQQLLSEGYADNDWRQARSFFKIAAQLREADRAHLAGTDQTPIDMDDHSGADLFIHLHLTNTQRFVKRHWQRIEAIAGALLDSPTGSLSYADAVAALAAQQSTQHDNTTEATTGTQQVESTERGR